MNTSRGKNVEHSRKMGQFNRVAFKQSGESLFDSKFGFDRQLKETLAYANVQKNGKLTQREQLNVLAKAASRNYQSRSVANDLVQGVSQRLFANTADMLAETGKSTADFLKIMLEPSYTASADHIPEHLRKKGKKKSQGRQITRWKSGFAERSKISFARQLNLALTAKADSIYYRDPDRAEFETQKLEAHELSVRQAEALLRQKQKEINDAQKVLKKLKKE